MTRRVCTIITLVCVLYSSAYGQSSDSDGSAWQFRVAPYAWTTGITGTTGIRGVDVDPNLSIGDVLEHLDGALMVTLEARRGPLSLTSDLIFASLSNSSATPKGVLFKDADEKLQEVLWTQTVGYSVYSEPSVNVDILGGFRFAYLDMDLDLTGNTLPSGMETQSRDLSKEVTWIDPVIGARGRYDFSKDYFVLMMGDVGGFDASSDFTWQTMGAFGYVFCDGFDVGVGYRALGYTHDRDGFKYNMVMHGPFIGAEFRF